MSLTDLHLAFDLVASNTDLADFAGPQPAERIARAERLLGIDFPPSYREFLLRLGCGDIAGDEFFGILSDDLEAPGVPNALWMTIERRKKLDLPAACLVVGATGDGADYVIDTSLKNADGDCPVVLWWPGAAGARGTMVARDFGEFLFKMVSEGIENWRGDAEIDD